MSDVSAFAPGDCVAWSHTLATPYGRGTTLKRDFVQSQAKKDPSLKFGTVVGEVQRNQFEVKLDIGEVLVLTADELVRVEE